MLFWYINRQPVIKYDNNDDPDDTFSSIPYEKGYSLLWYLETILTIPKFEAFLKGENQNRSTFSEEVWFYDYSQ